MPVVAMYEGSHAHIGEALDALNLDIDVVTFDKEGMFTIDGRKVPPEEMDVDYLWLSNHINFDRCAKAAFDAALRCRSLGVLQTFNAGLDDPIYKKLSDKGVTLCNSSAQGVAIAEYTLAQVMSVLHPIELQRRQQAEKVWKITPFREISRTHWLIVGFGPIGEALATRVKAFGAKTSVIRRSPKTGPLVDRAGTLKDWPTLLPEAEIIVFACSLNAETRGFADETFFQGVKPGAILVNVARGALIDDEAMIRALDDGRLETAILDVFHEEPLPKDNPLWTHPKVRLTPHTSFGGDGGRARWDALFLDNIQRFAKGAPLERVVDPADLVQ